MQYEPKYIDKPLSLPRTPDYIDVNKKMRILDTGKLSLDTKEINALELLAKTMPTGKARFKSNVMAIVGEGIREAEIDVFGNRVRTLIPRHIDKIVKTHNTISQEALNDLVFVWVYASITANNPPLYVQNGNGSIVFVESSGQQISFSPAVLALPDGTSSFTFLFFVNDTSTNSYTSTQEQLTPWVIYPANTSTALQLAIPLSTANLVVSKSSNQFLSFVWAVQVNLSSAVSGSYLYGLFQPTINGWKTGFFCGTGYIGIEPCIPALTAFSGSTTYFSATPSYYFIDMNGILYAVAIATDTSGNSYTPSSISASYWGINNTIARYGTGNVVATLNVTTPPNSPGSKPSYAAVSWYNGFYLSV